uniref:CARD domain-containing protein n=1 Tax=Pundamilia nyererei TaxID=303518 RepID=A0A3B4G6T1_9CICH
RQVDIKIKEHKVELINCLMGDVFILQCVHAKGILSPRQYGNLKHSSNPEQTVTNLIDLLMSKGEETCNQFLQILKDPDVDATYPQLKNIIKYNITTTCLILCWSLFCCQTQLTQFVKLNLINCVNNQYLFRFGSTHLLKRVLVSPQKLHTNYCTHL